MVGRRAPKKRHDLVFAAAEALPTLRFVVCGLDTELFEVSEPNVEILGSVDQSTLIDLYRAADLLLLPSHGEGQPLAALEALACGLPVVLGNDPEVMAELPDCVATTDLSAEAVIESILANLPLDDRRGEIPRRCVSSRGGSALGNDRC